MSKQRFSSQVVTITGASSGFGLALSHAFVAEGAFVAMVARNPCRLMEAAAPFGDKVLPLPCDVSNRPAVEKTVGEILARLGKVDILINNAGFGLISPIARVPISDARLLFETNFFGAVNFTQAILPAMKRQGNGHVVNMASLAGLRGIPNSSLYCASKAALIAFSDALRVELRRYGIAVTVICPSRTNDTPFVERARRYGDVRLYKVPTGFSTKTVVEHTLNAIVSKRRMVVIPFHAKLLHFASKFAPRLVDWYLYRNMPQLDSDVS